MKYKFLEIEKETEKAALIKGYVVSLRGKLVKCNFWCPKSLINDESIAGWFVGKKISEFFERTGLTRRAFCEFQLGEEERDDNGNLQNLTCLV